MKCTIHNEEYSCFSCKKISEKPFARILRLEEHKNYRYLIQQFDYCFQFIITDGNFFYQGYNIITPRPGESKLDDEQTARICLITQDMAIATIEELEKQRDPNYKMTKEQELGEEIVKTIEGGSGTKEDPLKLKVN